MLKCAGLISQPTAIFVGPIEAIDTAYVVINNVKYKADSPLHAVNLCFQAFWTLDCNYPERANSIWKFLQIAGYQINITDHCSQAINAIVNDIDARLPGNAQA